MGHAVAPSTPVQDCRLHVRAWQSMTEQMPEDLTETEEADRLDVDRAEDEGDTGSEVDRWEDEGATTAPAEPAGLLRA